MDKVLKPAEAMGGMNAVEQRYAPELLYMRGRPGLLRCFPRIAVVGTREPSEKGASLARRLAREIVDAGGIVVSGLARGIDGHAHRGALEAGGSTIAVIATPLSRSTPVSHRELQAQIAREHLVVSQFPEGSTTSRGSFPIRNRTMALVSDATVIVEAGVSSGTISQAWEALRLGRQLFLTQHLLDDTSLDWTGSLLEYGAHVLDSFDILLEALPFELLPREQAV